MTDTQDKLKGGNGSLSDEREADSENNVPRVPEWLYRRTPEHLENLESSGLPNVPAERPGEKWKARGGEFYLSSQYYEPEEDQSRPLDRDSTPMTEEQRHLLPELQAHLGAAGINASLTDPEMTDDALDAYAKFFTSRTSAR